jgi:hypothetical protein
VIGTLLPALLPALLAAQPSAGRSLPNGSTPVDPAPDGVVLAFARFADIFGSRLVAAFEAIPAARYGYRPTPAQQSVGYIAQHLEDANYSLCERFADLKRPAPTAKDSLADSVKARWPKDSLVARLRSSIRFCDAALDRVRRVDSPALASSLLAFETDLAEHYSQVATYMRLLDLVPPSALPPTPRSAIALPASELAPYAGVYQLAPGFEVEVTLRDDALFARSSNGGVPARLWPESPSDFFLKEADAQVTFTRDARGSVTGLVLHQFGRDRPAPKIR